MILTTAVPALMIALFATTLITSYVIYLRLIEIAEYLSRSHTR
jgi:hypothetical protein